MAASWRSRWKPARRYGNTTSRSRRTTCSARRLAIRRLQRQLLLCLHTADGTFAWRWRTGADVIGIPVVDDRNVYFVSLDNVLRALSRKTGVQQWARPLPLRPTRGPLKIDRTLIVSGIASMVRGYNVKDGTPAGEVPVAGDVASSPYAPPGLPQVLVVSRDIAKGATATLFMRQTDPRLNPPAALPNASKAPFWMQARRPSQNRKLTNRRASRSRTMSAWGSASAGLVSLQADTTDGADVRSLPHDPTHGRCAERTGRRRRRAPSAPGTRRPHRGRATRQAAAGTRQGRRAARTR